MAARPGPTRSSTSRSRERRTRAFPLLGPGTAASACCNPAARTTPGRFNRRSRTWPNSGTPTSTFSRNLNRWWGISTPFNPGKSTATGASKMRFSSLRIAFGAALLLLGGTARAQTPGFKNVGRTPTKQEVEAWDISVGPDGKGLPEGHGTAKEGAPVFAAKCAVCHGPNGEEAKFAFGRLVGGRGSLTTYYDV